MSSDAPEFLLLKKSPDTSETNYLTSVHEIIQYIPEVEPNELIMSTVYHKLFPYLLKPLRQKLRLSNIAEYSISKPRMAERICQEIANRIPANDLVITDAMANVGGMTLAFAKYFKFVNACEITKLHADMLQSNVNLYGFGSKVNVICDDYMEVMVNLKQDVIFFDPPWGGIDYDKNDELSLGINNVNICSIANRLLESCKLIVILTPYNFKMHDLSLIKNGKYSIINLDRKVKSKMLIIIEKNENLKKST